MYYRMAFLNDILNVIPSGASNGVPNGDLNGVPSCMVSRTAFLMARISIRIFQNGAMFNYLMLYR